MATVHFGSRAVATARRPSYPNVKATVKQSRIPPIAVVSNRRTRAARQQRTVAVVDYDNGDQGDDYSVNLGNRQAAPDDAGVGDAHFGNRRAAKEEEYVDPTRVVRGAPLPAASRLKMAPKPGGAKPPAQAAKRPPVVAQPVEEEEEREAEQEQEEEEEEQEQQEEEEPGQEPAHRDGETEEGVAASVRELARMFAKSDRAARETSKTLAGLLAAVSDISQNLGVLQRDLKSNTSKLATQIQASATAPAGGGTLNSFGRPVVPGTDLAIPVQKVDRKRAPVTIVPPAVKLSAAEKDRQFQAELDRRAATAAALYLRNKAVASPAVDKVYSEMDDPDFGANKPRSIMTLRNVDENLVLQDRHIPLDRNAERIMAESLSIEQVSGAEQEYTRTARVNRQPPPIVRQGGRLVRQNPNHNPDYLEEPAMPPREVVQKRPRA